MNGSMKQNDAPLVHEDTSLTDAVVVSLCLLGSLILLIGVSVFGV